MGQHDLSYRLFFAHQRMIQDLLREIVGEQWVKRIDLSSGERVDATFVSPRHENRESDVIWKFRRRDEGEPVYVYILLEFQSRPDPSMPIRLMGYESLFYQSLMATQPAAGWRRLPPVIPVVVYNGMEPWNVATDLGSLIGDLDPSAEIYRPQLRYRLVDESTYLPEDLAALNSPVADLFLIERSDDWSEVRNSVHRLGERIPPAEDSLRQAFGTWLKKVVLPRLGLTSEAISGAETLEEVDTMLAEKIDRWNRELREKSLREGLEQGLQKGTARTLLRQLSLKFGPLDSEVEERVRAADLERLGVWTERVLAAETLEDVIRD